MTDSLKFGPEWLRNLGGDGCSSGGNSGGGGGGGLIPPKYQLAEFRYGREEMLALYDRSYNAPEPLTSFTALYVAKPQAPLALQQMSEDETRLWNGGMSVNITRGRGAGSVDRGNRARTGRGPGTHFRGSGFEDEPARSETQPFPIRNRSFDQRPIDRSWTDRNGGDVMDWNGSSTSPRKELNRGVSGSSLMESNWRRQRGAEEDEGWRTDRNNSKVEKWIKTSSWREDKDRSDRGADIEDDKRLDRWDHKGTGRPFDIPLMRRSRTNHPDNHELPEWATENTGEGGGSFDASGAFHGTYSDDEDDYGERRDERKRGSRVRRVSEGNTPHNKQYASTLKPSSTSTPGGKGEKPLNGERAKLGLETNTKIEKETLHTNRRSLTPIDSPQAPSTPVLNKKQTSIGNQQQNVEAKKKDNKQAKNINEKTKEANTAGL
ncbi:unnamed protein product [Trichogramma brassicae]|uniref:Uncharacterized protein n=1 Tax=Trichogramma brassicae TaxID=86971 RepID=A0A6H5ILE2_9HYME|nr:unnamed protein product [Trichogramma brassicae]